MPTSSKPLILGSSSRYRKALLDRLGLSYDCVSPDIDETALVGETAGDLVARLAKAKAQTVASTHPNAVVIGSDQVCINGDQILGKPHNVENAQAQLAAASGKAVSFLTSLCVLDTDGTAYEATSEIKVQFRDLSAEEISRYIASDKPLDCAGSFKSEALGVSLFASVSTDDLTALEGLPLIKTCEFLRACGFQLP